MYPRVFSSSGEPGGRGPNSTCLRTCSKARSPSKSEAPLGDGLDVEGEEDFSSMGLFEVPLGQPNSSSRTSNAEARVKYRDKRSDEGNEGWSSVDIVIIGPSLLTNRDRQRPWPNRPPHLFRLSVFVRARYGDNRRKLRSCAANAKSTRTCALRPSRPEELRVRANRTQ